MIFPVSDPNYLFTPPKHLFQRLVDNARLYPDKVYYYGQDRTITYQQMCDDATQLAQQLTHALECSPKPIVAVSSHNNEAILHLTWACLASGICLAFLPFSHDPVQIASLMAQVDVKILVTDIPELQTQPWAIAYETLQQGTFDGNVDAVVNVQPETAVFIFQTSGTTGTPKWIQVNHGQIWGAIESMKADGSLDHAVDQVVYITPPLSHSYGLSSLLEYTFMGSSIMLSQGSGGLGAITMLINSPLAKMITAVEGVPHFYSQMVRLIKRINLPNLTHIGFGSGRLDEAIINSIRAVYPKLSYSIRYGLTETPSVVSHKRFTVPYADDWNSSGKILPIYDLRIVDQSGHVVDAGQQGEIQLKGDCLAWPYLGETAVSPYFATGDIGYINPDTQDLYIVGRKSLFLKVGGYRISPEYIESIINSFEGILECRISGTTTGILAEVVPANETVSQQTLLMFLATKLPSYAIPETVISVEAIPRTHSGKIKRH
ncbi:MAG: acyl--CoA ligase [Chloroflexi bacterium]|nr:acyl--CoA ligase [Chloroflexota bacterium]